MKKQFLKDLTDAGEVKVNFEKKDGTLRRMHCTTCTAYLVEHAEETGWKPVTENRVPKSNNAVLPVWDIEAKGWRNVPIDRVLFVTAEGTIRYIRMYQIVRTLDDSKFIDLKKEKIKVLKEEHLRTLHMNLWSMFTTRYTAEQLKEMQKGSPDKEPFGCSVSDYGWTKEVEEAFYSHPANAPIVKAMKRPKDMTWGMFVLDAQPSTVDDFTSKPIIEEGFSAV